VKTPRGLAGPGRSLWRSIADTYELEQHELAVLEQAARVADRLAALDAVVDSEGVMEPGRGRAHPALVESRQQRIALARLLVVLRLPDEDDQRPQRRGMRGAYRMGGRGGA
jgi:hypothetical protein